MKTFVSAEKAVCADEQDLSVLRAFVEDELMIRPSLGDQFRVGFFSADHSSQTDSSEIIEIKEMTNVMRILGKAFNSLRKDFLMYKNIIKGEYEENIEKHVSNLWRHINETAQSIEANHKKKLTMIRESFRQQLADAIAVIKTQYEGFYSEKINAFITSEAQNTFSMKLQTMLNKIREKELTIKSLEAQMVEHQNEALRRFQLMLGEEEMDTETIKEENSQYRQQIDKLQIKIIALEDAVKRKDNTIEKLDTDMVNVKKKLDKDQTTIVMLTAAYEKLTNDFTKEREAAINMNIKHKKEMEIQMALSEKQDKQAAYSHMWVTSSMEPWDG
uniref:Uncharacterized protein C10orf67 homolog, mitochondrial n=1 Tax=Geotrypetes seraphini TaxID=260995 RepID=A0A6P8PJK6_GEOSA|nr:uncharacterized protein C10orf67 homolog, mitochondrial [Geotrypetes seraphini]